MASAVTTRLPGADRREQILDVAMRLFARRGFEGTTTRQIARQAGVNEAIIFRHFPSKEHLYWAIIERRCRSSNRARMIERELAAGGDDRRIFTAIAEQFLVREREDELKTRLLLFSALERHQLSHRFFRNYVARSFELLTAHIRRRIAEGTFRDVDPLLAARGFLGMIVYHNLIQELFGGRRVRRFDPKDTAQALTDIWLQGMGTRTAARKNSANGRNRNGRSRRPVAPSVEAGSAL